VAPSRQEVRKQQLIDALARAKGNQSIAAEILGVSRVTIWNRMKRYGVKYTRHLESPGNGPRNSGLEAT
jgi:two-component system response regulator HydG